VNEFVATHRTKAGVEVEITKESGIYRVRVLNDGISTGNLFSEIEYKAVFEPIPKPKMVELPIDLARIILEKARMIDPEHVEALRLLVAAAEQEQSP
jgi:hypothetical protein